MDPKRSHSDESLLAGLASGDPDAAAAFVRRFQARVFGLALAIVGDRAAAEEVAQETFVRAWKHAGGYDSRRGAVASWLLTIARNTAVDASRHSRSTPMDPDAILALAETDPAPNPEDAAMTGHEVGALREALKGLPDDQRRALIMAAFGGMTVRQIAEAEQIPLGTAKTRIRSGILKLRTALEGER
ncbi:MAG TPA: sigma-70 family RNA polymerase sigma factor [Actinomycetota bacterium]|nr:sigma-70 family RNA polymerase sigma factor [Actinomycetota bacterium]